MAGYGFLVLGPSLHFWFNFMSKLFPKRDLLSTLKKMAMGQGIYGPTMTVVFFSLNSRLQGMRVPLDNKHLSYCVVFVCALQVRNFLTNSMTLSSKFYVHLKFFPEINMMGS